MVYIDKNIYVFKYYFNRNIGFFQLKADKEQHAMFSVFDENESWYIDENINTYCSDLKKVKREDPEFYKSNVMHSKYS